MNLLILFQITLDMSSPVFRLTLKCHLNSYNATALYHFEQVVVAVSFATKSSVIVDLTHVILYSFPGNFDRLANAESKACCLSMLNHFTYVLCMHTNAADLYHVLSD